ncbi:cupin domain-containing protein [Saccharothrix obliqua]|uniref:cupin domain-containing protein n=1 Tax=Saccharothrix obliqua TaxID=2861747 RepID=UPI001C5CF1A3|nr:cupin domain-containing protein [Saccharothrix obliqua]MBW4717751.1 cupin domain-containing protein [Saccharothrix obliqua]
MAEVIHHPAGTGPTIWFGDAIYTFKATTANTNGSLTFAEATVPPGGGPPPHVHPYTDEAFFILSGDLEFLNGEDTFRAGEGDFVWVPRGVRHRFRNVGLHVSRMLFLFSPGAGMEGFFNSIGTEAVPGEAPPPLTDVQKQQIVDLSSRYGIVLSPPPPGSAG